MTTPKPLSESSEKNWPETVVKGQHGQQIGQYQLQEVIGSGGMGVVYKAVHTRMRQVFALKTLAGDALLDPRAIERFDREMTALGSLIHPNIVRATDAGDWQGAHYLVMEYVEGIDLKKVVHIHGPLAIADACEAIRQAAVGLQYIHENKRVHRDLKPSNLMLTLDGQIKILDLGLALLYGEAGTKDEITGSHQVMGTADFMAPEQWLDSHQVDIRADLYSLGCTLYKLLTGKEPFALLLDKNRDKRQAHLTMPAPDIRSLRPEAPASLAAILERLLAKEPQGRFGKPLELVEALRPFCQGSDLSKLTALSLAMKSREDTETKKTVTYQMPAAPKAQPPDEVRIWQKGPSIWVGLATVVGVIAVIVAILFWKKPHDDLPWPADYPQSLKQRVPGKPLALVEWAQPRPYDPKEPIRGKVLPLPTSKTLQVQWHRRLLGKGVFFEMPQSLTLDSSPVPGSVSPTVLALDDDLSRNWFELDGVIYPPSPTAKNYGGLFFGWNEPEPGTARAYFLGIEEAGGLQLAVAPLTMSLKTKDPEPLAPIKALKEKVGFRKPLPLADKYRVQVRALPGEIIVHVNGLELGRLTPEFDPRGPCGIWAQEGQARFDRIAVTPLDPGNP
jgi:serine/threonine protein kinase